jgi:dUTP pyrophosphatase
MDGHRLSSCDPQGKLGIFTVAKPAENLQDVTPRYADDGASGADLFANLTDPVNIEPGVRLCIPTGVKMAIPQGYEVQIRPRSGLAFNAGITVLNSPGTIDSSYRGEIRVMLINLGSMGYTINPGDRIAQAVVCPVFKAVFVPVDSLDETERGGGGFGSSGK